MSASTEKKNRQAAREAGTDKKALAAAEAAKKAAVSKRKWTIGTIAVAVFLILVLLLNSSMFYTGTTAVKFNDKKASLADVNFNYASQYWNFTTTYGQYASLFGLDTSNGIAGLAKQEYPTDEYSTWREYFLDAAVKQIQNFSALEDYAAENGIALTEDEKAEILADFEGVDDSARTNGYASADKLYTANYGKGNTLKTAEDFALLSSLVGKVTNAKTEEFLAALTDEEVAAAYPSIAVRHILVKAEADENGEYTDAAKEAAKAKAEEILQEWKDGDATEESFAALAEKYSEDEGSNTNGGLYDSVLQGQMVEEFDAFCFDESRQSGDTGIVYGESGSYAGYHVMYFVGEGDPANNETGRNNLASEKLNTWLEELVGENEVQYTAAYRLLAGKI